MDPVEASPPAALAESAAARAQPRFPGDRPQWRRGPPATAGCGCRRRAVVASHPGAAHDPASDDGHGGMCRDDGRDDHGDPRCSVACRTLDRAGGAGIGRSAWRRSCQAAADVVPRVGSSPAERGGCGGGGHCRGGCAGRYPGARRAYCALGRLGTGAPPGWFPDGVGRTPRAGGGYESCRSGGCWGQGRLVRSSCRGHRRRSRLTGGARRPLRLRGPGFCGRLRHAGPRRPSVRESADPCRADPGSLRAVGRTCPRLHRAVYRAHCGTAGGPRAGRT